MEDRKACCMMDRLDSARREIGEGLADEEMKKLHCLQRFNQRRE